MSKIICSAPTKAKMLKLSAEFYCSANIIISENNKVLNSKLNKELGFIKTKGKRLQYFANL